MVPPWRQEGGTSQWSPRVLKVALSGFGKELDLGSERKRRGVKDDLEVGRGR